MVDAPDGEQEAVQDHEPRGRTPGTYTSTGITMSTPPSVSGIVSMPPPQALLPIAITAFGMGMAAMVARNGASIAVVTARNHEDVGVSRRRREEEAEPLEIVVGIGQRENL